MLQKKSGWSRRKFLYSASLAGGAVLWSPLRGGAGPTAGHDPQVAAIVAATMGIDTHNHIDVLLNRDPIAADLVIAGEMIGSGLAAICMTFAVDYQPLTAPGQAYDRFLNGLTAMDAVLAKNDMRRASSLADLKNSHAAGRPTVVQAVEGGHLIEGHVDRVEVAYQRGLRVL